MRPALWTLALLGLILALPGVSADDVDEASQQEALVQPDAAEEAEKAAKKAAKQAEKQAEEAAKDADDAAEEAEKAAREAEKEAKEAAKEAEQQRKEAEQARRAAAKQAEDSAEDAANEAEDRDDDQGRDDDANDGEPQPPAQPPINEPADPPLPDAPDAPTVPDLPDADLPDVPDAPDLPELPDADLPDPSPTPEIPAEHPQPQPPVVSEPILEIVLPPSGSGGGSGGGSVGGPGAGDDLPEPPIVHALDDWTWPIALLRVHDGLLDASSSYAEGAPIVAYRFSGPGLPGTWQDSPTIPLDLPPGTHVLRLEVMDAAGHTHATTKTVTVPDSPVEDRRVPAPLWPMAALFALRRR